MKKERRTTVTGVVPNGLEVTLRVNKDAMKRQGTNVVFVPELMSGAQIRAFEAIMGEDTGSWVLHRVNKLTTRNMKVKILSSGEEVEAYPLIMRKRFAEDILKGVKTVEFRRFSPRFASLFCTPQAAAVLQDKNPAKTARLNELNKRGIETFKNVRVLHFYNYANTFSLDVTIDRAVFFALTKEKCAKLNKEYGTDEFDELAEQIEDDGSGTVPGMFAFRIVGFIQQRGLDEALAAAEADGVWE